MYAIYANIYHQHTPVMLAYIYHTYGSYGNVLKHRNPSYVLLKFNPKRDDQESQQFMPSSMNEVIEIPHVHG